VRELAKAIASRELNPVKQQPVKQKTRDIWSSESANDKKDRYRPSDLGIFFQAPSHGMSYNPDPEAHQDLVGEATAFEVEKLRKRKEIRDTLHVPRDVADRMAREEEEAEREMEAHIKEYMDSLLDNTLGERLAQEKPDLEKEEEEDEVSFEKKATLPKTQKDRRKQRKKKEYAMQRQKQLAAKKKKRQLSQIPELLRQVKEEEAKQEAKRRVKQLAKEEYLKSGTKKLNHRKFEVSICLQ